MQLPFSQHKRLSWLLDLLFLAALLGAFYFAFLGHRPLLVPDEARYSEVAREMVLSHDYVTPTLNGVKYFEKPILFYWLTTAAIKLGGLSIGSVRSVNVLLGLLGCLLAYVTARKLYDRATGLLAGCILGTSTLYFFMSHITNHDLALTVMLSASLYAFLLAFEQPPGMGRRCCVWLAFAAAGLAVLTKGLIGIVFPGMIIGLWMLLLNNWRQLKTLYWFSSLAIFALVVIPWHAMVQLRNPEFFYFYFVYQQFMRYTTLMAHHYEPVWYFIPVLLVGFFPWTVFLPQAFAASLPRTWKSRTDFRKELFFAIWAVFIFLFFSFSKSKLISYLLPVIPPVAMLTARYLGQQLQHNASVGVRVGLTLFLGVSFVTTVLLGLVTHVFPVPDAYHATIGLYLAGALLLLGSIVALILQLRQQNAKAVAAMLLAAGLFLTTTQLTVTYLDSRTILPLAQVIKPVFHAEDEIVGYKKYYHDLPFYLEHQITFVGHFDEFDYGKKHQDTHAWLIDQDVFWQRWHSAKRLFVVMNKGDYQTVVRDHPQDTFHVLGETMHDILVTNHIRA